MQTHPGTASAIALIACLASPLDSAPCQAGIVPDHGLSWSTVTHAGNRPANAGEAPDLYRPTLPAPILAGSVGHDYRITTTEVTTAQWAEFVRAYAPFYAGPYNDAGFTSIWINHVGNGQFSVPAGTEQRPASVSWRMAARYCNWLCDNKAIAARAGRPRPEVVHAASAPPARLNLEVAPDGQIRIPQRLTTPKAGNAQTVRTRRPPGCCAARLKCGQCREPFPAEEQLT